MLKLGRLGAILVIAAVAVTAALLADERRSAAGPVSRSNVPTFQRSGWGEAGLREGLRE